MHLHAAGFNIQSAKAFELSTDPAHEIMRADDESMNPKERALDLSDNKPILFPPASVTAVEINIKRT